MTDAAFVDIVEQYAHDVVDGTIVAGKWTRLACQRQLDDLERWRTDEDWPYEWNAWHVDDVCAFVELLPHIEGEWGSPTIVLEPWQIFILGCVFGWRRKSDGHRRFNTVYLEVARKNAKSAIASAIALYCLTCEGEKGPQVKTAATTGDQARIIFDIARQMAERTPAFRHEFGIEVYQHSIVCRPNAGTVKPINAKASSQDGLNPHLSILDELHAHPTRALFDVLKSARGARKNPLSWYVTTAGYEIDGVCYEQRTIVTNILDGIFDGDHYFGIIYTLDTKENEGDPESDDPLEPRNWIKANPNLGVSVQTTEMEQYASEARQSPDTLAEFKTKRCNIWTAARGAYLNVDGWLRGDTGPLELDALAVRPCYGGLDLASKIDIAAWCLVWYEPPPPLSPMEAALLLDPSRPATLKRPPARIYVMPRFYVPEEAIEPRTKRGNVPYQRWADEGYLIATPGNVIDYAFIETDIRADLDRFDVVELAFDPWNATDVTNRLGADGIELVEFRQSFAQYQAPMSTLLAASTAGTVRSGSNPVLRWMARNLVARKDANSNAAPDRNKSADKIDGICALLMALGRAMVGDDSSITVAEDYEVLAV